VKTIEEVVLGDPPICRLKRTNNWGDSAEKRSTASVQFALRHADVLVPSKRAKRLVVMAEIGTREYRGDPSPPLGKLLVL
jgi:hypothetical protein